ncbi:MAG: hypothetical protein ACRDGT_10810 [Candidatus Limnocylindria bacterium]
MESRKVRTEFEIWDSKSGNLLQFERLEDVVSALRSLVRADGEEVLVGLSLDAVSEDGSQRMVLAEGKDLIGLLPSKAAA